MSNNTREKMISGAVELMRSRGINATSTREVVRLSNTPRGSIRHHFPGGKRELISAALEAGGQQATKRLKHLLTKLGAAQGLVGFIREWGEQLEKSQYHGGCPVMAVAVEQYVGDDGQADAAAQTSLLDQAEKIFTEWENTIAEALQGQGIALPQSQQLASITISLFEGAVARARAQRSLSPLNAAAEHILTTIPKRQAP